MFRFFFYIFIEFRKDDDVFCVVLRIGYFGCVFFFLFFVYLFLEIKLMDLFGGFFISIRFDLWGIIIIIFSSEIYLVGFFKYII